MTYQTGRNNTVAYKVESVFKTAPGASGGKAFPPNTGGLNLSKRTFASGQIRRDGLSIMGRHGSRSVEGNLVGELALGAHDELIEAVMRGTWSAPLSLSQSDVTSITTGTNTIVAASGDWIALGLRVGDVVRLANHSQAGNNNRNIPITNLTASTITTSELLTADAAPDSAFTLTRGKKLTRLAGTAYTNRTFTFEEYNADIDQSELFVGNCISTARFQLQPNGMILVTFGLIGADASALATGASPYFTSPTEVSALPMVAVDAQLLIDGVPVTDLTAFDLTLSINAGGLDVIGSYTTPAIFTNQLTIAGSISAPRKDLLNLSAFIAESTMSLQCVMVENESEPKDHFTITLPSVKFGDVNKNELGANGARIETMPLMIGYDPTRASKYDAGMIAFQTSAA